MITKYERTPQRAFRDIAVKRIHRCLGRPQSDIPVSRGAPEFNLIQNAYFPPPFPLVIMIPLFHAFPREVHWQWLILSVILFCVVTFFYPSLALFFETMPNLQLQTLVLVLFVKHSHRCCNKRLQCNIAKTDEHDDRAQSRGERCCESQLPFARSFR